MPDKDPGPDLFDRTRRKLDIKPFGALEYQSVGYVPPAHNAPPMFSVALAGSGWGDDAIYIFLAVDKEGISAQVLVPKSGDYPRLIWDGSYDGGLAVMKQIRQPIDVSQLRSLEFVDAL